MKKNMFKTGTALFATAMMMAAVLTGCSGSDSGASTTAPADTTATTTEGSSADNSSASGDTTADVQKIIDAGKLKVGTKVDVPKFGYQNPETGKMEGVEVDLAYEIAGEIFGCTADEAKDKDLVAFQGVTQEDRFSTTVRLTSSLQLTRSLLSVRKNGISLTHTIQTPLVFSF